MTSCDTMKITPVQVNHNSTPTFGGFLKKLYCIIFVVNTRAIFLVRTITLEHCYFVESIDLVVLFSAVYSIFPDQNNILYSYCMSIISKSTSCRILLFVLMHFFCCCYIEVVFNNGNN